MSDILFIGQAPHRTHDPGYRPLIDGQCGERLANLIGVDLEQYARMIDTMNIFDRWTGSSAKGDVFPLQEARERAIHIWTEIKYEKIVFVGKNVAKAFGFARLDYFETIEIDGRIACVIPHPSGINRFWNDKENVEKAKNFLRRFIS